MSPSSEPGSRRQHFLSNASSPCVWKEWSPTESDEDDVHKEGMGRDARFSLNGTTISECYSYAYLGGEVNMMNDLAPELGRSKRATWGAYKSIEDVVTKTKNIRLRAHLFNTTVLSALTYTSETWALSKEDENAVSVVKRSIERMMLGIARLTQVRAVIRISTPRRQSKISDAAANAKLSKVR